jgi:hypothetical protein
MEFQMTQEKIECVGNARPGDGEHMATRHVWARRFNDTAFCVKCDEQLDAAEAQEKMGDRR